MPVHSAEPRKGRARRGSSRLAAGIAAAILGAGTLAACGGNNGRITVNFYSFPDDSGAIQSAATNCSTPQYRISYNKLPRAADGQRQQLVRRLAAHDNGLDILGLDVTWEAEFAEAGWILPWTGTNKAKASNGTLKAALDTAKYKGKLWAVPYNSNTQLLWYRADLVPKPPKTWAQMIAMAEQLAKQGKPHLIEIQGAQYEGATVWFNSMVASAGGSILNSKVTAPALGAPAVKALTIMKQLADSPAADPSLSVQMEDNNRLAMETGSAAFELNYPFVYPSMKTNNPKVKTYNGKSLSQNFKWTSWPRVDANTPSRVTIGGDDLAISKYSTHADMAFKAALCLRDRDNQIAAAVKGGLPPTIESLYSDKNFQKTYPAHAAILQALKTASVRPKTAAYQSVSIVISHSMSPPNGINPQSTESDIASQTKDALQSKGLIP